MNLLPMNVAPETNHLGRSKFSADAYFNGQFASFRAYGRTLSSAEMLAPTPFITQPANGSTYSLGDTLSFSGSGTDFLNRPLGVGGLKWQINYIQDGQTNIVFGPVTGIAGGIYTHSHQRHSGWKLCDPVDRDGQFKPPEFGCDRAAAGTSSERLVRILPFNF